MFLPTPQQYGGSPVGNSYLSLWLQCRRKWFAKYLWPWEDGSLGLEVPFRSLSLGPRGLQGPGNNLMMGSLLHIWKEHWYRSGVRDGADTGEYSLDAAVAELEQYLATRRNEFDSDEAVDWARAQVTEWGSAFHRFYGPGGHTPLFPEEKILCLEDGRPAIELDLTVPLGVGDYVFTTRLDCVKLWQDRYLMVDETKTAAPSWVDRYITQLPKNSQFTGQMFALRCSPELKDLPWDKIKVTYHLKGWSHKSQFPTPAKSGHTTRTIEQLERFRARAAKILDEIDEAVNAWDGACGTTAQQDRLFPETGEHTSFCYAFNSECEFMSSCRMGFAPGTLGSFRPARKAGEPIRALDNSDEPVA